MFTLEISDVSSNLKISKLRGVERISDLYQFELDISSTDSSLTDRLGQAASLNIMAAGEKSVRHGIISQITVIGMNKFLTYYHVLFVPAMAELALTSDCRIFQDQTAEDIISSILDKHAIEDYRFSLHQPTLARAYQVQYRETDLDFVRRLIAGEGLFYYFEHSNTSHTLVIADNAAAYQNLSSCGDNTLHFFPNTPEARRPTKSYISEISLSHMQTSDRVRLRDYNYQSPSNQLDISKQTSGMSDSVHEMYDYPGGYQQAQDGKSRVKLRFESAQMAAFSGEAVSNEPRLSPARLFELKDHQYRKANREYVAIEVRHFGEQDKNNQNQVQYQNTTRVLSAKTSYRQVSSFPGIVMQGPQTATVIGPAGQGVFTDELGRVKVQFHWDRESQHNVNNAAWIRVAQAQAGNGRGSQSIPHIGNEVLVDFIDGNPNQPLVVASLYNGSNHLPYALPDNQTVSAFRSQASANSSAPNELLVDDKTGDERISIRAKKDYALAIENNFHCTVGNNDSEEIAADKSITIGGNYSMSIGHNYRQTIGHDLDQEIGKNWNQSIGKNFEQEIAKNLQQTIGKALRQEVAKDLTLTIGKNYNCEVAKSTHIKSKTIKLEANDSILLKTGAASIELKKNGQIKIKGTHIDIDALARLTLKGLITP